MAKECINCGRKVGFISGEHFNGLLCDECYNEFGGIMLINLEMERNADKYIECYNEIATKIEQRTNLNVDKERIKKEFLKLINSKYKSIFGMEIQEHIQKQEDDRKKELQRVDYANSFNEFYEYDVVTVINENHGTIDKEKMMSILSEHAKNGWKLHTIYSNELGKNALRILGFGTNSTACEDVLIFERRIPELD